MSQFTEITLVESPSPISAAHLYASELPMPPALATYVVSMSKSVLLGKVYLLILSPHPPKTSHHSNIASAVDGTPHIWPIKSNFLVFLTTYLNAKPNVPPSNTIKTNPLQDTNFLNQFCENQVKRWRSHCPQIHLVFVV